MPSALMRFVSSWTTRSSKPEYVCTMNQSIATGDGAAAASGLGFSDERSVVSFMRVPSAAERGKELVHERRHGRVHEEEEHPDDGGVDDHDDRRSKRLVAARPRPLPRLLADVGEKLAKGIPALAQVHAFGRPFRSPRRRFVGRGAGI